MRSEGTVQTPQQQLLGVQCRLVKAYACPQKGVGPDDLMARGFPTYKSWRSGPVDLLAYQVPLRCWKSQDYFSICGKIATDLAVFSLLHSTLQGSSVQLTDLKLGDGNAADVMKVYLQRGR